MMCPKMLFTLPSRCLFEVILPGRGLAVALDQPCKTIGRWRPFFRPQLASDGGVIFRLEIVGTKFCVQPDSRPLADADIPNGLSVSGRLPVKEGRARAGHRVH